MESQIIRTVYATSAEVSPDPAEVLRYMGAQPGDEAAQTLLESCMEKAKLAFSYRACFARFPLAIDGQTLRLPFGTIESADLARHLNGCAQIWLLAATAGFAIDRLISKYSALQPSHGLCYQAWGAAAIEAWCDQLCAFLQQQESLPLTTRFSPGYGDFPLEYQSALLALLDTQRRIGLTLSEGGMMLPTKSGTAVVGIRSSFSAELLSQSCASGCAACSKQCAFRRQG